MSDYGKVSLNIYSISINKEGDRKKDYVICDFDNGSDLYTFFKECMESWVYKKVNNEDVLLKDETNQKVIRLKRTEDDKPFMKFLGRTFSGLYESGDYGEERTVIDTLTGEPKYTQYENDAPLIPFYFLFHLGKDCTTGILILQRFKQFGVFGLCKNIFEKSFKLKHPDYNLRMAQLSSCELVKKALAASEMKGVILKEISHGNVNTKTVTQSINVNPKDYNLELVLKAKRGRFFPNKEELLTKDKFISIDGLDYVGTEFRIKIGNRERSFTRKQIDEFGYSCDITNDIHWGNDKMPTYDSINKEALDLLGDVLNQIAKKK